ncbi:uncharacterized protein LOC100370850 [Saccoglossus kowalevskii]|uniref:Uncharacterized protein LOC100370850 n=1 Tax=Saccoglossus kowalevskii TaxID=10224 RepID=A0ABM0GQ78_SACKO|nr:PREDICTED: uncharacterized protein LOC100370850 [Saccoglossus kowalevskii]
MRYRDLLAIFLLLFVAMTTVDSMGLPCVDYWAKWCGRRPGNIKRSHSSMKAQKDLLAPLVKNAILKILNENLEEDEFDDYLPLPVETDAEYNNNRQMTNNWL